MSEEHDSENPLPAKPSPPAHGVIEPNPFTPGRLFGVALLGASASLIAYYVFQQMDPEQRKRLRGRAFRSVKTQVRGWAGRIDPEGESSGSEAESR